MGPMLGPIVGGLKMKNSFNNNVSIHQKEHFEKGCISKKWLWLFGGPATRICFTLKCCNGCRCSQSETRSKCSNLISRWTRTCVWLGHQHNWGIELQPDTHHIQALFFYASLWKFSFPFFKWKGQANTIIYKDCKSFISKFYYIHKKWQNKNNFLKSLQDFIHFTFTFITFIVEMTGTAAAKNPAQHRAKNKECKHWS